jgi:hypothetical protein
VGCLGQRGREPAAGSGEPPGDRSRSGCLAEGSQEGLDLGRDAHAGWASVAYSLLAKAEVSPSIEYSGEAGDGVMADRKLGLCLGL